MIHPRFILQQLFSYTSRYYFILALAFGIIATIFLPAAQNDDTDSFQPYSQEIHGSSATISMIPVEGGTFIMGSPESEHGRSDDEGPQREVHVDSFWMGEYEITWEQYELFSTDVIENLRNELDAADHGKNISADAISLPTPPYVDMSFGMGKQGYPAINITHYAAVMFTKWLTAKTGKFYRLPTEAEWEYACRSGTDSPYSFGSNPNVLEQHAWYDNNSDHSYNRVGEKEPNPFGLHDMHGNVAEWTMDQYHEDYFEQIEVSDDGIVYNPWFKPTELYPRSVRGGSWQDGAEAQRCAHRRGSNPRWKMLDPQMPKSLWWHTSAPFLGFRIVRPKESPTEEEMQEYWIEAMQDY